LGRLIGNNNPLRASSASARQAPCHEPSPWKVMKVNYGSIPQNWQRRIKIRRKYEKRKGEHRSIPLQVKTAPILMTRPHLTEQMSIVKLCGLYLWQQTNVQQCPALSMVSTQNCPEKW